MLIPGTEKLYGGRYGEIDCHGGMRHQGGSWNSLAGQARLAGREEFTKQHAS